MDEVLGFFAVFGVIFITPGRFRLINAVAGIDVLLLLVSPNPTTELGRIHQPAEGAGQLQIFDQAERLILPAT